MPAKQVGVAQHLPGEEEAVLAEHEIDVAAGEVVGAVRLAVGVDHAALGLVEDLPAHLLRPVREVEILEVEGPEEPVEGAQLEEAVAPHGARPPAGVEHVQGLVGDGFVVLEEEEAVLEAGPHEAGLADEAAGDPAGLHLDVGGGGEDGGIAEMAEQGPEEIRVDVHVVVEEDEDLAGCDAGGGIVGPGEAQVSFEREQPDLRELPVEELDGVVGAGVVHDDHLVIVAGVRDRAQHPGKAGLEQMPPVPGRDYEAGAGLAHGSSGAPDAAASRSSPLSQMWGAFSLGSSSSSSRHG